MIIKKCEVLKNDTNQIWSYYDDVFIGSDLYNKFQNCDDPTILGFTFERSVIFNNDSDEDCEFIIPETGEKIKLKYD